jgi:predicted amidohydrolase YtcJ
MRYVAVTFVLLFGTAAVAFAQQPPAAIPDEIFYNGKIITVDPAFHIEEALAVKGEQVFAVGSNARMKALAGKNTRLTDLKGHTVIPGLGDNHDHLYNGGMAEHRGIDMSGAKSLSEMFDRIRQAVEKAKPGEVIVTNGQWDEDAVAEKHGPARQDLDKLSTDRVIVVQRFRGRAYTNSAGLKAAGISRETKTVAGLAVQKDPSGEPTGMILGTSQVNLVVPKLAPFLPGEEENALLKAQQAQLALGVTSIREPDLRPGFMRAYQNLRRNGKLNIRVSMGMGFEASEWKELPEFLEERGVGTGFGDHWLRLDCIGEMSQDGFGKGAWVREPRPEGGAKTTRNTPEQLREMMLALNRYGWRPCIHLSGDGALDGILDAYEAADKVSSIRDKRWVVEHAPMVNPDQMDRIVKLGVVITAQSHLYYKFLAEDFLMLAGKDRINQLIPMREMLEHKVMVSSGSDFYPYMSNNPFIDFYFYVTRTNGYDGRVIASEQKISREQALRVATVNNAYITFEEDVKGSLEPGKLADFLVLNQDILTVPEAQIRSLHPLATYVGGRKVFSSQEGGF